MAFQPTPSFSVAQDYVWINEWLTFLRIRVVRSGYTGGQTMRNSEDWGWNRTVEWRRIPGVWCSPRRLSRWACWTHWWWNDPEPDDPSASQTKASGTWHQNAQTCEQKNVCGNWIRTILQMEIIKRATWNGWKIKIERTLWQENVDWGMNMNSL